MEYQSTKTLDIRPHRRHKARQEPLEALAFLIFLMIGIYIIQGLIHALFIQ